MPLGRPLRRRGWLRGEGCCCFGCRPVLVIPDGKKAGSRLEVLGLRPLRVAVAALVICPHSAAEQQLHGCGRSIVRRRIEQVRAFCQKHRTLERA